MKQLHFIDADGSFTVDSPENTSYLYFPLASESGLKSAVTPCLGGDAKLDQDSFLLEPVSAENLHNNRSVRNFWCVINNAEIYSAAGTSPQQEAARFSADQDETSLTAGFMWHTLKRHSGKSGLSSTVTSFIPYNDNVEIMYVTIRNDTGTDLSLSACAAVPIYGRSADNLRDHRHVTSLLHRIETTENGVLVCPSMSFDERGHRPNRRVYYVLGSAGDGTPPVDFFPTVESFLGDGGSYTRPRSVDERRSGCHAGAHTAGKEAMGAFRFPEITLAPGKSADYIILLGALDESSHIQAIFEKYNTAGKVSEALNRTKKYWLEKVNVSFHTRDAEFDRQMKWISFQPFLRRLFGCSFLPHHDYGRGGRGWRDLWQDCLSLLLMDPGNVGEMIVKNFGGVRIDGTNATIIGEGDGNFIADRNGIARVWMDHAFWPLLTTKLYIDQTGDLEILDRQVTYFKDSLALRGSGADTLWREEDGNRQLTADGSVYTGSVLEHLLIQHLTAFCETGEHNIFRLRGADWNDALDMAPERGESVAFTCAYVGNLRELAAILQLLDSRSPGQTVPLMEEAEILLRMGSDFYDDISEKHRILNDYMMRCRHRISGRTVRFTLTDLADNLLQKADWLTGWIRKKEWIEGTDEEGWFNSYYDNHGRAVEGFFPDHVRMMLTGQVFSIMSGVASDEQIRKITKSADHYLYAPEIGGYRLNTDFHELKSDMGRMFGFAYGEKENGAVFSHMTVMYANALYHRGFVREGWKALKTLADTALDFDTSHIYPGIPEYFRSDGRGMYHYLTGAASWYMLTMITEVFGVRGTAGDLTLCPRLLSEQFDQNGTASVSLTFAGKKLHITYENKSGRDYGAYAISAASCDGRALQISDPSRLVIPGETLLALSDETHGIVITLL